VYNTSVRSNCRYGIDAQGFLGAGQPFVVISDCRLENLGIDDAISGNNPGNHKASIYTYGNNTAFNITTSSAPDGTYGSYYATAASPSAPTAGYPVVPLTFSPALTTGGRRTPTACLFGNL
jgi:hypothetical protein